MDNFKIKAEIRDACVEVLNDVLQMGLQLLVIEHLQLFEVSGDAVDLGG